jgi:hypothetical protein
MEKEITNKLKEVAKLAEESGDYNTYIVLMALLGAKAVDDDGILAAEVQKIIKEKLMPRAEMGSRGFNLN